VINREKAVALSLLTALIMTLVFVNLNVASTGADTGNPGNPDTMTFNSDLTMEFETGNTTWIGSGIYISCYNETKGENITQIMPGDTFLAETRPGWGFVPPENGTWWYIYSEELYGLYPAFCMNATWGTGMARTFQINETWGYWPGCRMNFSFPKSPLTYFEAEQMIPTIETYALNNKQYMAWLDFKTYSAVPEVGSWWNVTTYPGVMIGVTFNISYVSLYWTDPVKGEPYYYVRIDQLRNATGDVVDKIDSYYTYPLPIEGIEGVQLINTIKTTEYHISSPACLLPEDSWWNITYPSEVAGTRFHVDTSEEKPTAMGFLNYMHIDELRNATGHSVSSIPLTTAVESVEAVLSEAPTVDSIGACEWFNFINGPPPSSHTWWNVTSSSPLNDTLVGVHFYVDSAGEGVFHVDETSGDVTVIPAVNNVTAEELIPSIYIDPAITNNTLLTPGTDFTISIKTSYTLQVWSYEFTLEWNPAVLNCTNVANMDLFDGATFINGTVDNVNGKLSLTGAKFDYTDPPAPQVYPTSGNCTLANVTFTVAGTGDSDITLGPETRLVKVLKDGEGDEENVIDDATGTLEHGYFCNYAGPVVHDIIVTNITCYYYGVAVDETYRTWTAQVNVTALNNGTLTETFDLKVYYDNMAPDWLIGAETDIRIAASTTTTASFSWDLTDTPVGWRTIWSKAIIAFGIPDDNPGDNVFIGSSLVKLTGDLVSDGTVNATDFIDFTGDFPRTSVPPGVNADLVGDGNVDTFDFNLLVGNYDREIAYI